MASRGQTEARCPSAGDIRIKKGLKAQKVEFAGEIEHVEAAGRRDCNLQGECSIFC